MQASFFFQTLNGLRRVDLELPCSSWFSRFRPGLAFPAMARITASISINFAANSWQGRDVCNARQRQISSSCLNLETFSRTSPLCSRSTALWRSFGCAARLGGNFSRLFRLQLPPGYPSRDCSSPGCFPRPPFPPERPPMRPGGEPAPILLEYCDVSPQHD